MRLKALNLGVIAQLDSSKESKIVKSWLKRQGLFKPLLVDPVECVDQRAIHSQQRRKYPYCRNSRAF